MSSPSVLAEAQRTGSRQVVLETANGTGRPHSSCHIPRSLPRKTVVVSCSCMRRLVPAQSHLLVVGTGPPARRRYLFLLLRGGRYRHRVTCSSWVLVHPARLCHRHIKRTTGFWRSLSCPLVYSVTTHCVLLIYDDNAVQDKNNFFSTNNRINLQWNSIFFYFGLRKHLVSYYPW